MRIYLLSAFFIFCSFYLSAQCPDYQIELQNVESNISTAIQNLKKVKKAVTLEEAQRLIDKASDLVKISLKSISLAKEYASACDCTEGIHSATLIYHTVFDCSIQAQKAADCGLIEEMKIMVKKAITIAESANDELSESTSSCIEIPDIGKTDIDSTANN